MNKNKNLIHNQKHLTLSDRTFIEQELCQGSSFKYIGETLCKDPTTISKEIRKHRKEVSGKYYSGNCRICKFWDDCTIKAGDPEVSGCNRNHYCSGLCRRCWKMYPQKFCYGFIPITCKTITQAPYVCNGCTQERKCRITHYLYKATDAQKQYEKELVKSRVGINMTPEELLELNDLISPLVLKRQPLSHIFAVHANEIPVCRRTITTLIRVSLRREILTFQGVFVTRKENNALNLVRKIFSKLTAISVPMLILKIHSRIS